MFGAASSGGPSSALSAARASQSGLASEKRPSNTEEREGDPTETLQPPPSSPTTLSMVHAPGATSPCHRKHVAGACPSSRHCAPKTEMPMGRGRPKESLTETSASSEMSAKGSAEGAVAFPLAVERAVAFSVKFGRPRTGKSSKLANIQPVGFSRSAATSSSNGASACGGRRRVAFRPARKSKPGARTKSTSPGTICGTSTL
mmetsp:Transcript_63001/g.204245  ORF Transcript_63001/g.204245 Transcript_63001/m.204245 type:complete len:202 (-) Transcript_63001:2160-2765(-)